MAEKHVSETFFKQGQGIQCQTPGKKQEKTGINGNKQEETRRNMKKKEEEKKQKEARSNKSSHI